MWVAATSWLLFAVVAFVFAGDVFGQTSGNPEADRIASQLGSDAVGGTPVIATSGVVSIVVGIALIGLALLVLSGRGWARFALVGIGVFGVVVLAWGARWEAFAGFALLLLGTVALMLPSTHRFLQPA
jgi:hypothetical protein